MGVDSKIAYSGIVINSINKSILSEIEENLTDYDCAPWDIRDFLAPENSFLERQSKAIDIIEKIMSKNGKEKLLVIIAELAIIEPNMREIDKKLRDHVVHALLTFILGVYINKKFLRPKLQSRDVYLQWKIASLFHDVGYPIKIAKNIMKKYVDRVNDIKKKWGVTAPDVSFKVIPQGFENLTNNVNSLDLIQKRLDSWRLKINVKWEYKKMVKSGHIYHGIISSLSVLYVIDLLYQKFNPKREYKDVYIDNSKINCNQKYFEESIVSACSAIFIHNLPIRCFTNAKIDRTNAPLAFLLKLSDSLQEWERPSHKNKKGFSAKDFEICISHNKLVIKTNIPNEEKEKMKKEISDSLIAPDVEIV